MGTLLEKARKIGNLLEQFFGEAFAVNLFRAYWNSALHNPVRAAAPARLICNHRTV